MRTAWDFDEIGKAHRRYLQHDVATPQEVAQARDLTALARLARIERAAYADAFHFDPLLPQVLWPPGYAGSTVEDRHQLFRARLRQRLAALSATG